MAKMSEKKKTLTFERIVLTGTIDEINAAYKDLGPIELPARSLGMACRFRGLETVKTLVDLGLYFNRPDSPSFRGKYDCGYTSAGFYQVTSDYLLLLIDDCDCQSSFGIHSGYKDRYSGDYTDEAFEGLTIVSEDERAEIIEYLYQNRKAACFSADKLLYYSILSQTDFAIKKLKSLGVMIPSQEKEYLTAGGTGLDFQDYQKSLFRDDPKDLRKQFEYWFAELEGDEKLIIYKTYAEKYANILFSPEVYLFIKDRADFSKVSKKNILMKLVENNNAAAVTVLCNDGWAEKKALRDNLISTANEKGATDTLAVLIDYKNRTSDPLKEMEEEERKLMRELNANPLSVSSLKKLFAYEKLSDGTYKITRYKGDQTIVTVPEKIGKAAVTAIGAGAFSANERYCKNKEESRRRNAVTVVSLSNSIDTIEFCAFRDCKGLTKIDLPSGLKTIESETFSGCTSLTDISLPASITCIDRNAFFGCSNLTDINLPDSITYINSRAFADCSNLIEIDLPDSIYNLQFSVFDGCESLKRVDFPANLRTIESYAFNGCKALESINLPDSVKTIDVNAFQECDNLSEVIIPENILVIDNDFSNTKWVKKHGEFPFYYNNILISYKSACGKVEIKDGTRMIAGGAFRQSNVKEVAIPDSVIKICHGAFNCCEALENVCFGNGIKAIEGGVFSDCKSLRNVEFGENVTLIDSYAFRDCESLETIIVSKSIRRIERAAFYGCSGIKDLYITNGTVCVDGLEDISRNEGLTVHAPAGSAAESQAAAYKIRIIHDTPDNPSEEVDEFIMIIEDGTLKSCYGSKARVEINEEITKIGDRAFDNNKDITEVMLPETVTDIGYRSFLNCENLKHFEAPPHLTSIGSYAFWGCKRLETVRLNEKLNEIDESTFLECESLKSIVIPASVKRIGGHAFESCKGLEQITFEGRGISFGAKGYTCTFRGCESLKTIVLPIVTQRSLDRLDRMFENCISLEEIHFTEDSYFKSVSPRMFADCTKLKEIELPECVETIAEDAFDGCTELKRIFLLNEQIWKDLPTKLKNLYISGVAYKLCNNTANEFERNEVLPYIRKQKKRLLNSMPDNQDLIQVIDSIEAQKRKKSPVKKPDSKPANIELDNGTKKLEMESNKNKITESRDFEGKKVVTTGLTAADERWVKQEVESRGGEYKPKFVVSLDYLIYNPEYDHETVKLKRAKEQIEKGKQVQIITFEEFKKLIN